MHRTLLLAGAMALVLALLAPILPALAVHLPLAWLGAHSA